MMEMFANTLQEDACCWFYQGLPNKFITSFPTFLWMFLEQWDDGRGSMNGLKKFLEKIFTSTYLGLSITWKHMMDLFP